MTLERRTQSLWFCIAQLVGKPMHTYFILVKNKHKIDFYCHLTVHNLSGVLPTKSLLHNFFCLVAVSTMPKDATKQISPAPFIDFSVTVMCCVKPWLTSGTGTEQCRSISFFTSLACHL